VTSAQVTVYDPNPRHLWNRLHAALAVRLTGSRGPDEIFLEGDSPERHVRELDPLLWHHSRYLLKGPGQTAALTVIDEFLRSHAEKLVRAPLARALLQHDLWTLFDWAADSMWLEDTEYAQHKKNPTRQARRDLATRLALAMQRLALSADEIRALPDNYQAAVAAASFPAEFNAAEPARAFLPRDLGAPGGPWVLLGDRHDQLLAQAHVRFFGGRSTFLVFLRLPAGRDATVEYLGELRGWAREGRKGDPPQFPTGTQVALVRQLVLLDNHGDLVPTRLTETVQLRVFQRVDPTVRFNPEPAPERRFEIRLSRQDLLAGKGGGLYSVKDDSTERDHILFYGNNIGERDSPILASCRHCHQGPGIQAVNSFSRVFNFQAAPPDLTAARRPEEIDKIMRWKREQPSWSLLHWLGEQWPGK
jgi:hypothetical protein